MTRVPVPALVRPTGAPKVSRPVCAKEPAAESVLSVASVAFAGTPGPITSIPWTIPVVSARVSVVLVAVVPYFEIGEPIGALIVRAFPGFVPLTMMTVSARASPRE